MNPTKQDDGDGEEKNKMLVTLPRGVLTGFVYPFLGVRSLLRCALVCREWRDAADEDHLWKMLCARKWLNKLNMPKVQVSTMEPAHLYADAKYGRNTVLSVRDIKEILKLRNVDITNKLERKELVDAILSSQGPSYGGYSCELTSKWKTSYAYSARVVFVNSLTRQELLTAEWQMEFKRGAGPAAGAGAGPMTVKFQPNGSYISSFVANDLTWRFLDDDMSRQRYQPDELRSLSVPPGRHSLVQIGEYPALYVMRQPNFGLELHNAWVRFWQIS